MYGLVIILNQRLMCNVIFCKYIYIYIYIYMRAAPYLAQRPADRMLCIMGHKRHYHLWWWWWCIVEAWPARDDGPMGCHGSMGDSPPNCTEEVCGAVSGPRLPPAATAARLLLPGLQRSQGESCSSGASFCVFAHFFLLDSPFA
eukprot:SAG31_NODE_1963_length_6802_cov_2.758168_2_plen_144_part_00